jgi:hypothetical protein
MGQALVRKDHFSCKGEESSKNDQINEDYLSSSEYGTGKGRKSSV